MIPRIPVAPLLDVHHPDRAEALRALAEAAATFGFLILKDAPISQARVGRVIAAYRRFFHQTLAQKSTCDMALTGANRGWGSSGSEQVDPDANPDYKEVFDSGFELPANDPLSKLAVYAPNVWPKELPGFREEIQSYYSDACDLSRAVLASLSEALGMPGDFFADKFDRPMALLRGNFYPPRPDWAGAQDYGIAAHTDYGCLTLLAGDGTPGLEVWIKDQGWVPVTAEPGEFVINFGEMLDIWTEGKARATLHRVVGSAEERISVPLFFNPNSDTNVAPPGSGEVVLAGDHLSRRFEETYLHLKAG